MKNCDICNKPTYQNNAYLFDTATILASDKYIDFVIRLWVEKGLLPSSAISKDIKNVMRDSVRHDIKQQVGGTPWIVCQSCLSMFSVNKKYKEIAKKRAKEEWHIIKPF